MDASDQRHYNDHLGADGSLENQDLQDVATMCVRSRQGSQRRVTAHLRAFFWPFVLGTLVEVVFCFLMCRWSAKSHLSGSPLDFGITIFWDQSNLARLFWGTFWSCLIARSVCLCCWSSDTGRRFGGNSYAAIFMICSAMQWVFYLSAYYWLYDQLTFVEKHHETALGFDSLQHATFGSAAFQDCMREVSNHTVCQDVLVAACRRPYQPGLEGCVGHVVVSGQMCCVEERASLSVPNVDVGFGGLVFDISTIFMLERWLAVLIMSWFLVDNPLLPPVVGYKSFADGAWLDILDAVVFGDYVLDAKVRNPAYGIAAAGAEVATDPKPMLWLWRTWLVAFITSILSPIIYRACSPPSGTLSNTRPAPLSLEKCTFELLGSLRHLDAKKAHDYLDEALKLQHRAYVETSNHDQPVEVCISRRQESRSPLWPFGCLDEGGRSVDRSPGSIVSPISPASPFSCSVRSMSLDSSPGGAPLCGVVNFQAGPGATESRRPGLARWKRGTTYTVRYLDQRSSLSEEDVPLSRLEPDLENHGHGTSCGPGCCTGWFRCSHLADSANLEEQYDRRAKFLDSFRSLVFLELPFLCWRLYFKWDSLGLTSFSTLLIGKNLVWGVVDLLNILACGNESATIFSRRPIQALTHLLSGSALSSIWIGPSGVFMLAAEMASTVVADTIEQAKRRLDLYRTWMLVEKTKAGRDANHYDGEIHHVERMIDRLDSGKKLAHV
jgi:hypothetical protein